MQSIILAAGSGTRLLPLTRNRPKALIEVMGKPIVERIINYLAAQGSDEFVICIRSEYRKQFETLLPRLAKYKYTFVAVDEVMGANKPGTATSLQAAQRVAKKKFIVAMGDIYISGSTKIFPKKTQSEKPIAFTTIIKDEPQRYGVVSRSNGNIILHEKPQSASSSEVLCGLYWLDDHVFEIYNRVAISNRGEKELTDSLRVYASEGNLRIIQLPPLSIWQDIGTAQDLEATIKYLRETRTLSEK